MDEAFRYFVHDLRNLLTAILGNARFLKEILKGKEGFEEVLAILQLCERASYLAQNLMLLGQNLELPSFAPSLLCLNQVVEDTLPFLRALLKDKVEIELSLAPSLPMIKGFRQDLERILINLLLNAKDAMPEGGKVKITTYLAEVPFHSSKDESSSRDFVCLHLKDEGCGIPSEILGKIFLPFFTTKEKGTGLGLSTVYKLVKKLDGYIFVEAKKGKGASFFLCFPAAFPKEKDVELS